MKVKQLYNIVGNNYTEELLKNRGVLNVQNFLNPTEDCLQSWRNLSSIIQGIDLIKNLSRDNKIGIIVDTDVDGHTSAAIIYQYLKRLLPEIQIDIYLHEKKVHGINDIINQIKYENYNLFIIPDAGTNDGELIETLDFPVLVLDHHLLEQDSIIPTNMTLINNQTSPDYTNKELTGAGVVYQFCRGLDEELGHQWADEYIDLATVGIIGDMGSGLEIENQYIWSKGLKYINNYFLQTILRKQAYSITGESTATLSDVINKLTPIDISFSVVPLINAMIRVGTMEEKERLFTAFIDGHLQVPCNKRGAKGTTEEVAIESLRECTNAKSHQDKARDEAVDGIKKKIDQYNLLDNQILFIKLEDKDKIPAELNGLIANNLSNFYKHPTIVARLNHEGEIKGSLRGFSNCALPSFKKYLESTGLMTFTAGHDNSAGIGIMDKDVKELHEKANTELKQYDFGNSYYDADFTRSGSATDIKELIFDIGNHNKIWTNGNTEPIIYIHHLNIVPNQIQIIGKNSDTLKLYINGITYIKFKAIKEIEQLKNFAKDNDTIELEIVGTANINEWQGTFTPQIKINNIEWKNSLLSF